MSVPERPAAGPW